MSHNGDTEELDQAQAQEISLIPEPGSRLDSPTDREQATVLRGQEACRRLCRDHTWEDWKQVGAALLLGRSRAMREAGVNRPVGHRYKGAFAAWLREFGFENVDKADRARLIMAMDNLEQVEAWRATLTPAERLRLNHPSTILRRWSAAMSRKQSTSLKSVDKCRQNSPLKEELSRLSRECERLGGDVCDPADRPEDIAAALIAKLSRDKAAAVASAILKALEEKVAE